MKEADEKLSLDFVIKSLRVAEKSTRLKAITLPDPKLEEINGVQNVDNKKSRIPSEVAYDKHSKNRCEQCGKSHYKTQRCPAYGTKCAECNKFNHWARVCKNMNRVNKLHPEKDDNRFLFRRDTSH
ncbi:hypothetical protein EB796_020457 [Bugula neritina]|uniref:Uncharacterized protein n=1 Tax=Bugula neritina TaxID=10212 RepID=A0A7J7J4X0_BUGNE|nr:hypothetical protein EB796_020457 [Bugula neritina]